MRKLCLLSNTQLHLLKYYLTEQALLAQKQICKYKVSIQFKFQSNTTYQAHKTDIQEINEKQLRKQSDAC